jgi:hypothetical protein
MGKKQLLGLVVGASLLVGYEPAVEAMPVSRPTAPAELSASDGLIVKAVTASGASRRQSRRVSRRTSRRHSY